MARSSKWKSPDGFIRSFVFAAIAFCAGCQSRLTRFDIVDYGSLGEVEHYYQDFDECYYRVDGEGAIDIVARRRNSDDAAREESTQVVHVRSMYQPIPGQTADHQSTINALVRYTILAPDSAMSFEGCGFVFTRQDQSASELTGDLEASTLVPQRRVGNAMDIFDRPKLTGRVYAARDDRRVVAILNEIQRALGPLPNTSPPLTDPKLR